MLTRTLLAGLATGTMAVSANAALNVQADFTFDDASALAPFTVNGDANVAGGQLVLDGDGDFIQIADPLAGATDNFIVEAIFTPTAFAPIFQFVTNRADANTANNTGDGILIQDFNGGTPGQEIHGLNNNVAVFGDGLVGAVASQSYTVSYVRQNGVSSIYIDGVLNTSTQAAYNSTPVIDTLTIGANERDFNLAGLSEFTGTIDRVRLSTIDGADDLIVGGDGLLEVVPEPSSLALLGLGGLLVARRRRD